MIPEVPLMFLFRFNLMRRSKPKDFLLTSAPASASWQWSSSMGDWAPAWAAKDPRV